MFEQAFKNIDDILHKDAGCSSELDYVEQTSWILFLKYLSDLEQDKVAKAELAGKEYKNIIAPQYQWNSWAAPKNNEGKLDYNIAMTGDDLIDFVNRTDKENPGLFQYLKQFKTNAESPDTIEYKIGEIFSELKNKIQSGYTLREVINLVDALRFRTHDEKHEMSSLYEDKIQRMGNAGRNGGEYYTPRPLIKTIVKVVAPKIGETVYDGAVGSAGFLCEAFDYIQHGKQLTTTDVETLQKRTFYGKEKKSLAYIIGIMNMILHGVEAPHIIHTNTLAENISDIQEKDRYGIILANPPFGGNERAEVQQNFPIKTSETASLFLQHFIKSLKTGGRAGIVIKNTFLSNGGLGSADASLRKELLSSCNLHTILDLPGGAFTGAGVKTVVLFFEKGAPTKKIWYYQLNLSRNLGKTNPLNEHDLEDFLELQKSKSTSKNSWEVSIEEVDPFTFDLSPKNPSVLDKKIVGNPEEVLTEIRLLNEGLQNILKRISLTTESIIRKILENNKDQWKMVRLSEVCEVIAGQSPEGKFYNKVSVGTPFYQGKKEFGFKYLEKPTTWTTKVTKKALKGDILMSVRAPVGPVNISTLDICIGRGLAAIRPGKDVNVDYLFYFLKKHENEVVGNAGAVFNSINKSQIESITLPLPPIEVQNALSKLLNGLNEETAAIQDQYQLGNKSVLKLKDSVLNRIFNL